MPETLEGNTTFVTRLSPSTYVYEATSARYQFYYSAVINVFAGVGKFVQKSFFPASCMSAWLDLPWPHSPPSSQSAYVRTYGDSAAP